MFLVKNAEIIEEIELSQNAKLSKLVEDNSKHQVNDLIFNFSSHGLTDSQESILMKGLNYALPPKSFKYEDYLLNFEVLFRSVNADNDVILHIHLSCFILTERRRNLTALRKTDIRL